MSLEEEVKRLQQEVVWLKRRIEGIEDAIRLVTERGPTYPFLTAYEQRLTIVWDKLVDLLWRIEHGEKTPEVEAQLNALAHELFELKQLLKGTYLEGRVNRMYNYLQRRRKTFFIKPI